MRLRRRALLVFLLAAPVAGGAVASGTQVQVGGGRVLVHATGAPLTEVLSRFSEATGTQIVYDAAKPRELVTVEIDAASQAEALSRLLEGQGLSYVLRLDPSGEGVEMLFLMGAKGAVAGRSGTTAAADERPAVPIEASIEPQVEPETVDVPEELNNPNPGEAGLPIVPFPGQEVPPGQGVPPQAPATPAPFSPGMPAGMRPGAPPAPQAVPPVASSPAPPSFPQVASYPSSWR
jgi:hypothetical protein